MLVKWQYFILFMVKQYRIVYMYHDFLSTHLFGHLGCFHVLTGASLVAQTVKNLPAMQETWVQSLGREDPLEKGMATNSSILAWRISWTEEPGGLPSMGSHRVEHD